METEETRAMIPYSEETNHSFDKAMINTATLYNYFDSRHDPLLWGDEPPLCWGPDGHQHSLLQIFVLFL